MSSLSLSSFSPFYFPSFSRPQSESLLARHPTGTFIIRPSSQTGAAALSIQQNKRVLHVLVHEDASGVRLSAPSGLLECADWTALIQRLKEEKIINKGIEYKQYIQGQLVQAQPPCTGADKSPLSVSSSLPLPVPVPPASSPPPLAFPGGLAPPIAHSQSTDPFAIYASITPGSRRLICSEYRGLLSAFIVSHVYSSSSLRALAEWREKHDITKQEHESVLLTLGLTATEFDERCASASSSSPSSPHSPSPRDSPGDCAVCLSAPRACAFMPCGHVCVCMECAGQLSECVLCRTKIEKSLKVFL